MSPVFQPPTVNDVPRILPETRGVPYLLMRHYSNLPRGRSVIKIGGVYQTVDNPEQSTLDLATEVYLGGHIYTVTQTVADALTAAGYTVTASFLLTEGGFNLLTEAGDSLTQEV